jgi:AcrR family transcriptional regulator
VVNFDRDALGSEYRETTMSQTRDKLLQAATELFARNGFHAIGLDAIIDAVGVSKQTFYNHFESRDALVLATLEMRRQTESKLFARLFHDLAGSDPRKQLYANIDVIQAWFRQPEWSGCICIRAASEFPSPTEPAHKFAAAWFEENRQHQQYLATLAGARDPHKLSIQIMTIVEGVINVRHITGSESGVAMAREMLHELLDRELPLLVTHGAE